MSGGGLWPRTRRWLPVLAALLAAGCAASAVRIDVPSPAIRREAVGLLHVQRVLGFAEGGRVVVGELLLGMEGDGQAQVREIGVDEVARLVRPLSLAAIDGVEWRAALPAIAAGQREPPQRIWFAEQPEVADYLAALGAVAPSFGQPTTLGRATPLDESADEVTLWLRPAELVGGEPGLRIELVGFGVRVPLLALPLPVSRLRVATSPGGEVLVAEALGCSLAGERWFCVQGVHHADRRDGMARLRNRAGLVALAADRPHDAEAHFRAAIENDPRLADTHYNLACTLVRLGRLEQAFGPLAEGIRRAPARLRAVAATDPDLHPLRADVRFEQALATGAKAAAVE